MLTARVHHHIRHLPNSFSQAIHQTVSMQYQVTNQRNNYMLVKQNTRYLKLKWTLKRQTTEFNEYPFIK
ncbi:hypothetical protein Hanom_Chr09g00836661 [Helianthus anomalus]